LRDWRTLRAQAAALDSTIGRNPPALNAALSQLNVLTGAQLPFDAELKALDVALVKSPIERMPEIERPYFFLANVLAQAHRPDRARAVLAQYQAAVRDTALRRVDQPDMHGVQANIAIAEHRWRDAVEEFRKSDQQPDGPASGCAFCLSMNLMYTFSEAGMADSALAQYELYRKGAWGSRPLAGPDLTLGARGYELVAKLYESKGDTAKAAEHYRTFIDLWKNADPELQPRVAEARQRLLKLTPVEKARP
jgi:tetratricopeptide (TPR) repeat protein